ncbi:MAG: hypothetical protein EOM55_02670 [Clostridia bacterium]|nr:hypothetical protein [Clostridia bacterium]
MFEKILEYQKLDGNLLAFEREVEKDPAKQNLLKAMSLAKDSQSQLILLDETANKAIKEYENCKKEFEKNFTELDKFNKEDLSSFTVEVLNAKLDEINALLSKLASLERTLSFQAENISTIIKNSEHYKKSIILNKQKYNENKEAFEGINKKFAPQIDGIKKQMLEMEKQIDPKILAKYKHLRQDRIFPVFVPLNGNSCGGCSMEIPSALMNKLKENGYLECEQCRRYVYID